jgi:hypothetical protein
MLALILGSTREKNEHPSVDPPLIVGGLSLVERAVLAAQRAGVWRSVVVGVPDTGGPMAARLRARGANVTFIDWPALPSQDFSGGVLLIRHSVLVEPRALGMLLDRSGTHEATDGVLVAGGSAGDPDLAFLPGSAAGVLAGVNGADDAMQRVARLEPRREVSLARFF